MFGRPIGTTVDPAIQAIKNSAKYGNGKFKIKLTIISHCIVIGHQFLFFSHHEQKSILLMIQQSRRKKRKNNSLLHPIFIVQS